MKNAFVIDENIIYHASMTRNERDEISFSAGRLLYQIADNCHHIAITEKLYVKYLNKIDEIKNIRDRDRTDIFIHLLNYMLRIEEKISWYVDLDVTFPDNCFDPDDYDFVSLASRVNGILVTNDNKLIRDLANCSILRSHNFQVKRPEDAIIDAQ